MALVERMLTVVLSIGVTYNDEVADAAGLDFGPEHSGESQFAFEMADVVADQLRDSVHGLKLGIVGNTKYLRGCVEDVPLSFDLTNVGVSGAWSEDVNPKEDEVE